MPPRPRRRHVTKHERNSSTRSGSRLRKASAGDVIFAHEDGLDLARDVAACPSPGGTVDIDMNAPTVGVKHHLLHLAWMMKSFAKRFIMLRTESCKLKKLQPATRRVHNRPTTWSTAGRAAVKAFSIRYLLPVQTCLHYLTPRWKRPDQIVKMISPPALHHQATCQARLFRLRAASPVRP